ncbi:acetylornithine aminotransferase [Podospora conica]|nr:acetylornithine aminotransferase [Schizothecium conicum]
MAFRASLRLAARSGAASARSAPRRLYSQAAAVPTSTLAGAPRDSPEQIRRDAALPNPDPTPDSASARLVAEHAPYMVATYSRPPPVFVRGAGSYLWDHDNRKYLDLTAGIAVNSLGHCDPECAKLIAEQSKTLIHASNLYHNPWTGALSKLLVETTLATGGMHDATSTFLCNSGSEANEAAIKFARKTAKQSSPQKTQIISFGGAFHGRTMGSLSATPNPKYQAPFSPMVPDFSVGVLNDIPALATLITSRTAGVLVEPIQGEGGVRVATDEFLIALARRCREVGAVLVHDEIQCGLGRTGTFWAHARLPAEAHPDVVTSAKALGNGFPVGAVVVNGRVAGAMKVGDHGTTFGGNPLASRVAYSIVGRLAEQGLLEGVKAKGEVFRAGFERLRGRWPGLITEVRGRGLILGVQLTEDPAGIVRAARERGVLVITAGENTLRFVPSLLIGEGEIEEGLRVLEEAIEATR